MLIREFWANRLVRFISWAIVLVGIYLVQPFRLVVVSGPSMLPTFKNHELAFATTSVTDLKRGDVVVLDTDHGTIVKRIAYLPGDWVDGVFCYGQWTYARDIVVTPRSLTTVASLGKALIPGGYIFVTGDNPSVSLDSRQLGAFPISDIRCVLLNSKSDEVATGGSDLTYRSRTSRL